jgi:hypothetical protein
MRDSWNIAGSTLGAIVLGAVMIAFLGCSDDTTLPPVPVNSPPVADAGPDQTVILGTVTLDGSMSSDADGDPLAFRWVLASTPPGSAAALSDSTASAPTFVADAGGDYVAWLVVNDGTANSTPDTVTITVDPSPDITVFSRTIGAGLQYGSDASLDIPHHGGVIVRIESDDPSIARVAPDASTPGTAFIDIVVPDGEDTLHYVVQGVAGTTGTVTVTASAPGFDDGTGTITVVQPAVYIIGLSDPQSVGTNREFTVLTGIPDGAGTTLDGVQGVSAGNASVPAMTVTSSSGTVAHVSLASDTGASITFDLAAGVSQTRITFVPLSGGPTTVSASIPGFAVTPSASVAVTVDQPGIALFERTIGAGLQYGRDVSLDIPDHGGVTVRIESDDPSTARIAPDASTPGTAFIDVVVPDGEDTFDYVVQGVAGTTGTVTVTASAPGFADGTGIITVVQPAVYIVGLSATQSVGTNREFSVFTGTPDAGGITLNGLQGPSAGNASPLAMTVTSSSGTVAHVSLASDTGASITFDLAVGVSQTRVTFVPLSAGPTTVSASIPGFAVTPSASVAVTVN